MADPERTSGVDPIIAEARKRWDRIADNQTVQKQREAILAAKKFRAGDQWDIGIREARQGKNALQGVAAQPPRPCLTIDRLSQPVRQVSNQIKTANFAIDVVPNSGGADQETADIIKGYLRRVQNAARSEGPVEWAADGAVEGGIGWFRILTDYVETPAEDEAIAPTDPRLFDQELKLGRIANNLTVYDDPSAVTPTRCDSMFRFIVEDISRDEFERRWPEADVRGLDEFASVGNSMKHWVSKDEIRIAEYWRVTYTKETWAELADGTIAKVDEVPEDATASRIIQRPKVTCYKINACEILEQYDWLGSRIPQVPILGEELNVDGSPVLRGMITEGMDAQRMINYTYSAAMEGAALAPKSPFVAAAGQTDPYRDIWQTANTYNYSVLPYEPISIGGTVLPPPQRNQAEPPIQAFVELMRISEEALKATTGYYDPGLGKNKSDQSGVAIQSLAAQSDLGSSNYGVAVMRALIYAGELMVEILPKLVRPGQTLHIMGQDEEVEPVIVGQPFQKGPNGVQPIPPGPHVDALLQQGMAEFYDLGKGRYNVTVIVGKANATKREEGAAALGALIPHLPPEMAAVATPDYVEQLDFEGSHKIAERLRNALPPGLREQDGEEQPIPPQVQAQMQQMQGALQQAQQAIATDQAKQQATLEKAKIDAAARLQEANIQADTAMARQVMQDATTIAVAHLSAAAKGVALDQHAVEESQALGHQAALAHLSNAHEAAMAESDREHQQQMADLGHQQAMEQQAVAEPPEGAGAEA